MAARQQGKPNRRGQTARRPTATMAMDSVTATERRQKAQRQRNDEGNSDGGNDDGDKDEDDGDGWRDGDGRRDGNMTTTAAMGRASRDVVGGVDGARNRPRNCSRRRRLLKKTNVWAFDPAS